MSRTSQALYATWAMMVVRCTAKGGAHYASYGGRGISVCERWQNSFEDFRDDMGPRPPGTTLDRIDVNGNYEPRNCRWADRKTQSRNKRNSRFVVMDGVRYHIAELSEKHGIGMRTLSYRIGQNWPIDRLLNPARQYNNKASQAKAAAINAEQKRAQKRCKRGHSLKGKNVYLHQGHRSCRACRQAWDRFLYYDRKGRIEDYMD